MARQMDRELKVQRKASQRRGKRVNFIGLNESGAVEVGANDGDPVNR